ncbi:UNVERIFIED_CONTAM: hypothetical protein Slati_0773300 [Sesamum latifolium]|uniref:Uncharacterized protein n=1 Tax=Sesamum latifolium TaxID=2727402 RepID=A0AAW2XKS2_9LAMI
MAQDIPDSRPGTSPDLDHDTLPRSTSSAQVSAATLDHVNPRMTKQVKKDSPATRTPGRLGLLANEGIPRQR